MFFLALHDLGQLPQLPAAHCSMLCTDVCVVLKCTSPSSLFLKEEWDMPVCSTLEVTGGRGGNHMQIYGLPLQGNMLLVMMFTWM